ncbi:hypothetical protein HELRODRAFT_75835 [Helobdella robusta]|uniref:NADH dehydrogenase [ubiquinone] 1 alpha subcomplex subunit 2 n=1 Tax=Helobdella robusta TaxID=6412 RepID=T1G2B0_HELRO|nr:hypothetical protein HELRODRAFT_75835 [Helobdella robusta]ESO07535.1 hypothetical protein HELRODRAFT_75835 [Helobdella robusta]
MASLGRAAIKLGNNVKEIRVHLCQKSLSSKGVRDFIEQQYVELKKTNPTFPFLIRECSNVEPKIWARYEFGKEKSVSLANLTSQQVSETLKTMSSSG